MMGADPPPSEVADAVASFCEEYPDGERAIETVLGLDADRETWSFDDVPLDSGTFGELVSRGIVTKVDGEYRVSNREAVRAGLDGDPAAVEDDSEPEFELSTEVSFDSRAAAALAGALAVLFVTRIVNYRSVVRDGTVVSPSNDPYHYRYWVEQLLAESDGLTDTTVITDMPEGATQTRPLTHAANWFFAELLGGDQWAAEMVAAWLPVVSTIALGVVVYWLAVVVTDDVRVGVASVILLALTPVHAVYTNVGYLEHRLHQYFWLGVTLLTLAWLAVDLDRRRVAAPSIETAIESHLRGPWPWVAAVALGVALAFSTHAWGGGILHLVPVAGYVALKVASDVRAGVPPTRANLPVLAGVAFGGVFTALLHVGLGWHELFTAVVPLLVLAGAVAVVGLGELWHRLEWPIEGLLGVEVGTAALGLVAFRTLQPDQWARLLERAGDLFFREGAVETTSLFAREQSFVLGPVAQFGLHFYLAVLVLGWACWFAYRRYAPGWLLLSVYATFWLVLAAIQGRFAAQLAIPFSVMGGLGFVYLLAWADLVRIPAPFRGTDEERDEGESRATAADGGEPAPSIVVPRDVWTIVAVVWITLLICGLSLFFVPSLAAQTTYSDAEFQAATAIDEHATAVDREYPENFVLSEWGDNRMYNYFVSGEAERYGYALDTYEEFQTDDDPDGWYDEFDENGVGYVVMSDVDGQYPDDISQAKLHDQLGTGGEDGDPLEHYQAIYVSGEVTAFAVVPGATIEVPAEPGETVTIEAGVTVSGVTLPYERSVTANENGTAAVTVPYPGEYSIDDEVVEVSTVDVENGSTVAVD